MDNNASMTLNPALQEGREKYSFSPLDLVYAWLTLPLGLFFVRYIVCRTDGFQASAFFLLIFVMCAVYVKRSGFRLKASHIASGVMICAFSAVFSVNSNPLVHFLCFMFLTAAQLRWTQAVSTGTDFVTRFFPLDLWDSAVYTPFRHFDAHTRAVSRSMHGSQTAARVRYVVIGLLMTLPLTFVVGALLSSADDGVRTILNKIWGVFSDDFFTLIVQIFFCVPCAFFIFGAIFGAKERAACPLPTDEQYSEKKNIFRICPALMLYVGVTPICLLYLIYVISQTSYFFSAFAGTLPENIGSGAVSPYAEYARKGFFELCVIAVIDLFVIIILNTFARRSNPEKKPAALKVYSTLICLFTLFIIATALAKMILYINEFGLTPLRLYTSWFMVLLAAVFLITMLSGFFRRIPLSRSVSGAFTALFAVLCFSRPDALIARYNIERYIQGTLPGLDTYMLTHELSDDAYAVMIEYPEIFDIPSYRYDYSETVRDAVIRRYEGYGEDPFSAMNFSAQAVKAFVEADKGLISQQ